MEMGASVCEAVFLFYEEAKIGLLGYLLLVDKCGDSWTGKIKGEIYERITLSTIVLHIMGLRVSAIITTLGWPTPL